MPTPRPGSPRRLPLPRRTARLRLTVLYGGAVFLACGATLLAVTKSIAVSVITAPKSVITATKEEARRQIVIGPRLARRLCGVG